MKKWGQKMGGRKGGSEETVTKRLAFFLSQTRECIRGRVKLFVGKKKEKRLPKSRLLFFPEKVEKRFKMEERGEKD